MLLRGWGHCGEIVLEMSSGSCLVPIFLVEVMFIIIIFVVVNADSMSFEILLKINMLIKLHFFSLQPFLVERAHHTMVECSSWELICQKGWFTVLTTATAPSTGLPTDTLRSDYSLTLQWIWIRLLYNITLLVLCTHTLPDLVGVSCYITVVSL